MAVDKTFLRQQILTQLDRCMALAYAAGSHFAQHGKHAPASMQTQAEADARLIHLIEDYAAIGVGTYDGATTHPEFGASKAWDASQIKSPGWDHVFAAFVEGAREARANPEATDDDFRRAADGHTKRVFEEVDPVSEAALRTESWRGTAGVQGGGDAKR